LERHEVLSTVPWWKDTAAGPSQRTMEAEGSPISGTRGRAASSPDNAGTGQHRQMAPGPASKTEGVREEPAAERLSSDPPART
jgi:hypothetical protein